MNFVLYAALVMMCIMVDAMLLWHIVKQVDQSSLQRSLEGVFVACITMMLTDVVWSMHDGGFLPLPRWLAIALNTGYFMLSGYASWRWFLFSEASMKAEWINHRLKRMLITIPLGILAVLLIISVPTGCIFSISVDGHYVRGPLYILQAVLAYHYLVPAAVMALNRALRAEDRVTRTDCMMLAGFMVMPVAGGILQVIFPGVPALFCGITLSMLMEFIHSLSRQISLDTLTRINNRNSFYKYMAVRLQGNCDQLWLLFMDGDHFKEINDTWGHNAGDEALVRIADTLKHCVPHEGFVARFGGDEFLMVMNAAGIDEINDMKSRINEELARRNRAAGLKFDITLSIGAAHWNGSMYNVEMLLAAADDALYHIKKARTEAGKG